MLRKAATAQSVLAMSGLLPPGTSTSITKAGSLLVTMSAPTLLPQGFAEQHAKVEAGIQAAVALYEWAKVNAQDLAKILVAG